MNSEAVQQIEEALIPLRRRRKQAVQRVEALDADIAALERARVLIGGTRQRKLRRLGVKTAELRGLSAEDAAVLIAKRNGGLLESLYARPLMIAADILPNRGTQASARLWEVLSHSDKFESVRRGVYRLIDDLDAKDDRSELTLQTMRAAAEAAPQTGERTKELRQQRRKAAVAVGAMALTPLSR